MVKKSCLLKLIYYSYVTPVAILNAIAMSQFDQ